MLKSNLVRTVSARIPTATGAFQLYHYRDSDQHKEHLALVLGEVRGATNVLTRVHSECFTGDVLGSQRCDCGAQLQQAMNAMAAAGQGLLIYLRQEGRGIGLEQKLRAYNLQDQGHDTVDANLLLGHGADEREYSAAAAVLADLGVDSVRLMTNNPAKIEALTSLGIAVDQRVPIQTEITVENEPYLRAKVARMRHLLSLPSLEKQAHRYPHGSENGEMGAESTSTDDVTERIEWIERQARAHHASTGQPFVTVTYAQTLNGAIAAPDGQPLLISSSPAMQLTHRLRAGHDAILVGIGTVLADNPRLTVRLVDGHQPQPIVLDTHLRFPHYARLLQHPRGVWIATAQGADQHHRLRPNGSGSALDAHTASQIRLLSMPLDDHNTVDLPALLREVGRRGIRSIMVEGGAYVLTRFLDQGLANHVVVTISPQFLEGRNVWAASSAGNGTMPGAQLHDVVTTQVGPDIILWGRPALISEQQLPATTVTSSV